MKIIREPLIHFLLAGVALFVIYSAVNKDSSGFGNSDHEIVVTEGRIKNSIQKFKKVWQRPPTEVELDGLLQAYVREEVLYREALSMGLDAGDEVVRRRMAQKLEFISEDIISLQEPTDADLHSYFDSHKEEFRRDARVTFHHAYLNTEKRGEAIRGEAESMLARLKSLESKTAYIELSDPSMLSTEFTSTTRREIADLFGEAFAIQLLTREIGEWSGPIESAYGLHLVYVADLIDGDIPSFDDIRDIVVREWTFETKIESKKRFYQKLRGRYDVIIEELASDSNVQTQVGNTAGL